MNNRRVYPLSERAVSCRSFLSPLIFAIPAEDHADEICQLFCQYFCSLCFREIPKGGRAEKKRIKNLVEEARMAGISDDYGLLNKSQFTKYYSFVLIKWKAVLVVLIVLELVGVTNIFNKI